MCLGKPLRVYIRDIPTSFFQRSTKGNIESILNALKSTCNFNVRRTYTLNICKDGRRIVQALTLPNTRGIKKSVDRYQIVLLSQPVLPRDARYFGPPWLLPQYTKNSLTGKTWTEYWVDPEYPLSIFCFPFTRNLHYNLKRWKHGKIWNHSYINTASHRAKKMIRRPF